MALLARIVGPGLLLAGSLAATLSCWSGAHAGPAPASSSERDLKAAFLFNFTRFVDWPADAFATATSPVTIGILGEDPFGESLDRMVENEVVHGRRLVVRRLAEIDDADGCQILFVSAHKAESWDPIRKWIDRRSILTVGDGAAFASAGGMIGFEKSKSRVRLHINVGATRTARLKVSSQLLRQAKIVGETTGS